MKKRWLILAAILLFEFLSVKARSQKPTGQSSGGQAESNEALKFLGSYSAPSAIAATETGHVSAHPPSPPTNKRLRRIETGPTLLPPWPLDLAWTSEEITTACGGADIANKIQGAQHALETQSYQQATTIYEQIARDRAPCLPLAWNLVLARAYGRRPAALDELATAQSRAPSPTAGHLALGLVRLALGDATLSRSDFDDLDSGSAGMNTGTKEKGATLGKAGHEDSSAKTSAAGVHQRDALWAKAILGWASNQLPEARKLLVGLTSLEPDSAAVWFALGGVALDEARDNSRRLAEAAPEGSWNRRLESEALEFRYPDLARSILAKESKPELINSEKPNGKETPVSASASHADENPPDLQLQRLESQKESPPILYQRVRAALRLSELAYGRASHSPLFNSYFYAIRALAAEEESDEAAAEREYRAGLARNPDSAPLHAGLGHLFRQQRLLGEARDELAKAVALDPSDPVATFELGDVYQRQGEQTHASTLLSKALEIDPGLLVARWSRAKAYLALGNNRQALSDLEAAAPADNTGELQWQLSRLYRDLGRDDLAQKAQERSDQQRQQLRKK